MFRTLLALPLAALTILAPPALADTCKSESFSKINAETYLAGETALLEGNAPTAIILMDLLQSRELNCYEKDATHRMKAAALLVSKDFDGALSEIRIALADLEPGSKSHSDLARNIPLIEKEMRAFKLESSKDGSANQE